MVPVYNYDNLPFKIDPNNLKSINFIFPTRSSAKNRRWRLLWKCSFWLGLILLLIGSCLLTYGYVNKERAIIIGSVADHADIVDTYAVKFNDSLGTCRVLGFLVFMAGGCLLAVALLLPSFLCYKQCIYREDVLFGPEQEHAPSTGGDSTQPNPTRLVDYKHIQPQSINKVNPNGIVNVNYKTIKSEY